MAYERIEVLPISGAPGAEIICVDLKQDLDNQTWSEIYQAFVEHLVLMFPGQLLEPFPVGIRAKVRRHRSLQILAASAGPPRYSAGVPR
jgi:hypothetical protein